MAIHGKCAVTDL